jgi:histidinol-phosphate aminotransferase
MYASFIDRPVNDKRVIVTRTFSKAYGLAGLRLGYAIASPKVVEEMRKFLTEAGLNAIVAEVAGLVLGDTEGLIKLVKRNSDDRQEFFNSAMVRRLKPISSSANFVMMNTEHPAQELIGHFRKHNVLIGRQFPPMNDYIRVSLGTPDEMRAFWRVWDMLPWSKQLMQH